MFIEVWSYKVRRSRGATYMVLYRDIALRWNADSG